MSTNQRNRHSFWRDYAVKSGDSLGLGTMDFGPKNGGFLGNVYGELPAILAQKRSFFATVFNVLCEFLDNELMQHWFVTARRLQ